MTKYEALRAMVEQGKKVIQDGYPKGSYYFYDKGEVWYNQCSGAAPMLDRAFAMHLSSGSWSIVEESWCRVGDRFKSLEHGRYYEAVYADDCVALARNIEMDKDYLCFYTEIWETHSRTWQLLHKRGNWLNKAVWAKEDK